MSALLCFSCWTQNNNSNNRNERHPSLSGDRFPTKLDRSLETGSTGDIQNVSTSACYGEGGSECALTYSFLGF